ncbi:helix-turn-helix transcriptional regulator [Costertonia aggregata]|uniref:Helix-turn-helix transcriptional regulator n=1 Tax=Costertonia aggregata TaxID=343403 RepID=A0A7H9AMW5_9FLAO|nr:helix-turn-helix transcriptional regulator [Costertonia aggregata]QLG44734.1 helix-turn-helix transcriptional regulator [Costertonia aggregata]
MRYQEKYTNGLIANFIKSFWEFETADKECHYEILPDGLFDLIFEIRNEQISRIFLTGVWTKQIKISIPKDTRLIGVRFKLIAAEYIFKQSIKTLKNTKTELPKTFLGAQNQPIGDFEKFTSSLSQKIHYSLKKIKEIDSRKFHLFQMLYQLRGEITVKEISESIFWSSRQINRYFNDRFGFSLKTFCNILKCNSSFSQIANGQLFPEQEYYDQAHFIKEIKRYTGATPKDLYQNKNDRFLQLLTLREF